MAVFVVESLAQWKGFGGKLANDADNRISQISKLQLNPDCLQVSYITGNVKNTCYLAAMVNKNRATEQSLASGCRGEALKHKT